MSALIFITVLMLALASSTLNCVGFTDAIYMAAAFLPCMLYFQRHSQVKLMLVMYNVFFAASMLAEFTALKVALRIPADVIAVTFGDTTFMVAEYNLAVSRSLHGLALITWTLLYFIIQMAYYFNINSTFIKSCDSKTTYRKCYMRVYDRLYGFKSIATLFVLAYTAVWLNQYNGKDLIHMSVPHCGIIFISVIFLSTVIGSVVQRGWNKQLASIPEKVTDEMETVDLEEN